MITLEQIIKEERQHRTLGGQFGIDACKESIRFDVEFTGKHLHDLLEEYVDIANRDMFFNRAMVLACFELINETDNPAK